MLQAPEFTVLAEKYVFLKLKLMHLVPYCIEPLFAPVLLHIEL